MNDTPAEPRDCSGQFVKCVRIHEDELRLIKRDVSRPKKDGTEERVNYYEIPGKERPALVLNEVKGGRNYFIVWYTCTKAAEADRAIEVTHITKPPIPKRAFLKSHPDEIRRIPHTLAWCGACIGRLDPTSFDYYLKEAQKVSFVGVQSIR